MGRESESDTNENLESLKKRVEGEKQKLVGLGRFCDG